MDFNCDTNVTISNDVFSSVGLCPEGFLLNFFKYGFSLVPVMSPARPGSPAAVKKQPICNSVLGCFRGGFLQLRLEVPQLRLEGSPSLSCEVHPAPFLRRKYLKRKF